MSFQRTARRANDRRATKRLIAAEKKAAKAKGKVEPKPAKLILPGKSVGSIVTRTATLKAKAERSKERRAAKHQIIAAAPAIELPFIPPRSYIDQIAERLAEKSAGATFGPIHAPMITQGKVTNRA